MEPSLLLLVPPVTANEGLWMLFFVVWAASLILPRIFFFRMFQLLCMFSKGNVVDCMF